jgi:hypothetical protein
MNHKTTNYEDGYEDGIYGDDFDEEEQPSDTSIADLAHEILTEADAIRECEVGAIAGAVTEVLSSAAAVAGGITMVPIDAPQVVPEIQFPKAICDFHFERASIEVPVARKVLGTNFCSSCFNGLAINPAELVGANEDDVTVYRIWGSGGSRVRRASSQRELHAGHTYWQRNKEKIKARRAKNRERTREYNRRYWQSYKKIGAEVTEV